MSFLHYYKANTKIRIKLEQVAKEALCSITFKRN